MHEPIRILLADDHAILRDGIRALLNDESDMQVVGEADNGRWAVEQVGNLKPDVVLLDIAMPLLNGLEAARHIKRDYPDTHILILTMHQNDEYVSQMLEAGAAGYVLKHAAGQELVTAIRAVAQGGAFFSPRIARVLADAFLEHRVSETALRSYDELTPREREVFQLVAEGYTNREIAGILSISIKTVKTHRLNLMQKLDLHDKGELIKYAIQIGVITP